LLDLVEQERGKSTSETATFGSFRREEQSCADSRRNARREKWTISALAVGL